MSLTISFLLFYLLKLVGATLANRDDRLNCWIVSANPNLIFKLDIIALVKAINRYFIVMNVSLRVLNANPYFEP